MANIDSVKLPNGNSYNLQDVVSAKGSQPNLLLNPWFTVNQRGVTSFSGSSDDVKTADRWLARRATGSVNSNGISFAWDGVHSTNGLIATHIEDMPDLFGKTVTLSALVNGSIISYSFTLNDNETKYVGDNNEFYIDSKNLTGGIIINYYNYTTTAVTVRAMKLEIGSTSTLHLDTAPDYTTELLKCQRHYLQLDFAATQQITFMVNLSSTLSRGQLNFPTKMRAIPTPSITGSFKLNDASTDVSISSLSASSLGNLRTFLNATCSNAVAGHAAILVATSSATIAFSAEL